MDRTAYYRIKGLLVFAALLFSSSCQIMHPKEKDLIGTWYAEDENEYIKLYSDGTADVSGLFDGGYFYKALDDGEIVQWKLVSTFEDYGTDYKIHLMAGHHSCSVGVHWSLLMWDYYLIDITKFDEDIVMYTR